MRALETHLLVELRECNPDIIKNLRKVKSALISAAKKVKAKTEKPSLHKFSPFGISGAMVIADSRLTIRTWPEHAYAIIDIFTCRKTIKPEVVALHLIEKFECGNPAIVKMKRGVLFYKNKKMPHKIGSS